MKRHHGLIPVAALALAAFLAGCADKSTSLNVGVAPEPAKVGSQSCINTCHAVTPDHITGLVIAATWANALHTIDGGIQCEDCHGGGGNHFGVGPIPEPNPTTHCAACHGFTTYVDTAHYNGNDEPPPLFFQRDPGTEQAEYFGRPEFRPDNVTPVTRAQHIEQCSRCHNPSQQFIYNLDGTLAKPRPAALPVPRVGCGACHNGHDPVAETDQVTQRGLGTDVPYPRFRDWLVDPASGAQTDNAAAGIRLSTINLLFNDNGAVFGLSTPNYALVHDNNNEIHPDRLCAVCHAKGRYLFSGLPTHQEDVHGQWKTSGHGDRPAAAFAEFSADPVGYGFPDIGTHMATYPFDMSKTGVGATATTSRNASYIPAGSTSFANGYACYKCHNGIGSIAYQDNVEGTAAAPIIYGDVTVTCITCHDPHAEAAGITKNLRKPLVMTKYSGGGLVFSGNVFYDNTAVPAATGNATICVFCHQGRESGFTLFSRRLGAGDNVLGSFLNPHYLGTGAMLWGRNGYEYGGRRYGVVVEHQRTNCFGCHMAAGATEEVGGHTWRIISEDDSVVNNATCNARSCHNGAVPATNSAGEFDGFIDTAHAGVMRDYDLNGTVESMAIEIMGVENLLIALFDNNGILYDDTLYPYFLIPGTENGYVNWTTSQLKAAFNLSYVIKGLPSGETQIGQPNPSAATHNFRYNLQLLMDSYEDLYNNTPGVNPALPTPVALLANRPTGSRNATNYNPQAGGGYDPLQ